MTIQIHGVYEYDTGRKDYVRQCQEVYRIYVYKKIRRYYKCLLVQIGTDRIFHEHVSKKFLEERCTYIGPAYITWKDLFQIKENNNAI